VAPRVVQHHPSERPTHRTGPGNASQRRSDISGYRSTTTEARMSAAVKITQPDHTAEALRELAARSGDAAQVNDLHAGQPPNRRGWIDRRCGTRSIATTPKECQACDPSGMVDARPALPDRGANGGVEGACDQRARSRERPGCPLALRRFAS
jgi:hypothetical protein